MIERSSQGRPSDEEVAAKYHMTLKDMYAGQALLALISTAQIDVQKTVGFAWKIAEAMMEARFDSYNKSKS